MAQGTTKGIPIDTDINLTLNSDQLVSSQKAIKSYIDNKQHYVVHTMQLGVTGPLVINTGAKGLKTVGGNRTLIGWRLVSDVSTTSVVDVWVTNSAMPTNSNSICGSAKPSLTAATYNSSTSLPGWTTSFSAGDVFRLEVESNNSAVYLSLELDFIVPV